MVVMTDQQKLDQLRTKLQTATSALSAAENEMVEVANAVDLDAEAAVLEDRPADKALAKRIMPLRDKITDLTQNKQTLTRAIAKLESKLEAEADEAKLQRIQQLRAKLAPGLKRFEELLRELGPLADSLLKTAGEGVQDGLYGDVGVFLLPPRDWKNQSLDWEVRCLKGRLLGVASEMENHWQWRHLESKR